MVERSESPVVLVKLDGHAFRDSIDDHGGNAKEVAARLFSSIERNGQLVTTRGNGPQVGYLLARQRASELPLDAPVARTEDSRRDNLQQPLLNDRRAGGRRALIANPRSLPLAIDGPAATHLVGDI